MTAPYRAGEKLHSEYHGEDSGCTKRYGVTEVTPYPLKTQGFHCFLILLFGGPRISGDRSFLLHPYEPYFC